MWFQFNPLHWGQVLTEIQVEGGTPKSGQVKQTAGTGKAKKITASGKVKRVKGTAK